MFAVIMAGGGGTRLWPKSREHHPKQMHALISGKPLIEEMTDLLQSILGGDQVYIVTSPHHAEGMRKIMPFISGRIIVDPYRRDTAACIGLAAVYLSKIDPEAVMGVFASDHYIGSEDRFAQVVKAAEKLAAEGHVVTIGISPTGPATGYGYIQAGDLFGTVDALGVYRVRRFVEKPDRATAEQYCASGDYFWNSGMFAWSIPTVLRLFEKHLPDTYARLMRIRDAIGTPDEQSVINHEYRQMERISIDYGIMEKLDDILVIPGNFGWNDIGSWATVLEIASKDHANNAASGKHISIDTRNCLVMSTDNKIVATIGVEDLIIVDTDDALLVCHKDRAQDVKKVVEKLKEGNLDGYL
jgi:mannose-1-phosphate guanylyltransferase